MFALLRMECTQILAEAEEMWQQPAVPASEAGTNSTGLSSGAPSPQVQHRTVTLPTIRTIASPQYQQHPSMDERERREINSSTMALKRQLTLNRLTLNTSWTSRIWRGVTTWRRCSGSPMEKVQPEG